MLAEIGFKNIKYLFFSPHSKFETYLKTPKNFFGPRVIDLHLWRIDINPP